MRRARVWKSPAACSCWKTPRPSPSTSAKVSLYEIGLRRGEDAEAVIERIESLHLDLKISKTSERESNQQYEQMLQAFAWSIAAIAIFIGGLGMMNAMVMSVLERTREIGTLRALGWSRWRVLWIILGESVTLSGAGRDRRYFPGVRIG